MSGSPQNQPVPTGECGKPNNADAASIGFTAQVFCNDFTTTIPNTNGTGLAANWLNCNGSTGTVVAGNVWFMVTGATGGSTVNCTSQISQLTDANGGGNQALRMRLLASQLVGGNNVDSITQLISVAGNYPNFTNLNNNNTHGHGYFEWTWRVESNSGQGWGVTGNNIAFWNDTTPSTRWEPDWFETIFGCCDTTVTVHGGGSNVGLPVYSVDQSIYHTLGVLYTANTAGNTGAICLYIDGAFQKCAQGTISGGLTVAQQRTYTLLWNGIVCNGSSTDQTCQLPTPNFTFVDLWIKSVRIFSCPGSSTGDPCLTSSVFFK